MPRTALKTPFRYRHGRATSPARSSTSPTPACAGAANLAAGQDEAVYLAPLEETLDLGKTQAERWLDKYHGEWAGDLTRIFDEAEM